MNQESYKMCDLREQAIASLKDFSPLHSLLPEEEWQFYIDKMRLKRLGKGEFLIKPGENATFFAYLYKGLLKHYFNTSDGHVYISRFDDKDSSVADYSSLLQECPARLYIEALEDSVLLVSPPGLNKILHKRSSIWHEVGRVIAEKRYIEVSNRTHEFLSLTAKERYLNFIQNHGHLLNRISQKDIASYLGITPSSLNRILKNLSI